MSLIHKKIIPFVKIQIFFSHRTYSHIHVYLHTHSQYGNTTTLLSYLEKCQASTFSSLPLSHLGAFPLKYNILVSINPSQNSCHSYSCIYSFDTHQNHASRSITSYLSYLFSIFKSFR